jgi:hypothetical protein
MLPYLLLAIILNYIYAFEPSCTSCKYFMPSTAGYELGLCNMFKNICYHKGQEFVFANYASHCRSNENLCGKTGFLYESTRINIENSNKLEEEILKNDLIELNNRCCGEVNETDEIEQLEKDFFEVFQKIKKHNKKRIYKTTQDLYKLFKNKK